MVLQNPVSDSQAKARSRFFRGIKGIKDMDKRLGVDALAGIVNGDLHPMTLLSFTFLYDNTADPARGHSLKCIDDDIDQCLCDLGFVTMDLRQIRWDGNVKLLMPVFGLML
jgi:hypothetical protein